MAKQYYCFLERFNNYFNRKLIRKETLEDYQDSSADYFIPVGANGAMTPFDFNPNDNITTEIIVNDVPFDPDYFLLLDADEKIVSRWFVLEQKRNRKGQWLYFLRRDVLADSFNDLLQSPVYVERGVINDIASPLLLNNEDLRVNQIKKKEILLKDQSLSPWLVLYLKKGVVGTGGISATVNVEQNDDFVYLKLTTPITQWQYYQYLTNDYKVNDDSLIEIQYHDALNNCYYKINENASSSLKGVLTTIFTPWPPSNLDLNVEEATNQKSKLDNQLIPNINTLMTTANTEFSYAKENVLLQFNGKIIKDSDGKYWQVGVSRLTSGKTKHKVTNADSPSLKASLTNYWNLAFGQSATPNNDAFKFEVQWSGWRISLTERKDFETTFDFSAYTGKGTQDSSLFDAICMPYGEVNIYGSGGLIDITTNKDRSMMIMNSIARTLTENYVLDFQILPFCPCQNLLRSIDNKVHISYKTDTCIEGIYSGQTTDLIIVCDTANITLDVSQSIKITDNTDVPSVFKMKYINDCSLVRLCSPNYNGVFEMSLAKNGGSIEYFNVDMTLRPFNPYIHVNPNFKFLYGEDFNDVRGLVCGGDFSLGIINDAWNSYEIQNKNYQAIFDRQIQNIDVNNAINLQEATWGAVAGTVTGTASGAVAGGMVGAGYGAIAGAVVGGVASGIGGAMDLANLQKRQQEARNYAIDNYNLSLGNIRALPYSITKTSALTYNNKLFVFVEIYECSDEEKEAYYEKLKYNGMSVRKISNINNFISQDNSNYFRGRLIRNESISEDNHYFEILNEEMMKGVFI